MNNKDAELEKLRRSLKIREALQKDFNNLYVKRFTADWRNQRFLRKLEIDIMSLDNLEALLKGSVG